MANLKELQQNQALAQYGEQRGVIVGEGGLTGLQNAQLMTVVKGYLREWSIQFNHDNFMRVLPVIQGCIKAGLSETKGSDIIQPTDNLSAAFKKGYKERQALKNQLTQDLPTIQSSDPSLNILAIPQPVIENAQTEFQRMMFTPELKASRDYLEWVNQRRPVYDRLLEFGREQVEALIPGSKEVQLSEQQAAALVRNLIFGWVALNRPKVLMETEEMMAYKEPFIQRAGHEDDLKGLAESVGLNQDVALPYLKDLVSQVEGYIKSIPALTNDLDQIGNAFRRLTPAFLIVNPFYKLTDISETQGIGAPTLWDEDKSKVVVVSGVKYRVPNPDILRIASFRRSVDDAKRSMEFAQAANLVELLYEDIEASKSDNPYPKSLTDNLASQDSRIANLPFQLASGVYPRELTYKRNEIEEYIKAQLGVIQDETQIYPLAAKCRDKYLEAALNLLGRYRNGDRIENIFEEDALDAVYYVPSMLMPRLRLFLRDRITQRIRNFEYAHASVDPANSSLPFRVFVRSERYFDQALNTTAIDALDLNSRFMIKEFLDPKTAYTDEEKSRIWFGIVEQQKGAIERELLQRAKVGIDLKKEAKFENAEMFYGDSEDSLRDWVDTVKGYEEMLSKGVLPKDEGLFARFLSGLRTERETNFRHGMLGWREKISISDSIQEILDGKRYSRTDQLGKIDEEERKDREPGEVDNKMLLMKYGPAKMIVRVIARLTPPELLQNIPITLDQVVHHRFPPELMYSSEESTAQRPLLSSQFRRYLETQGFTFSDEEYDRIIHFQALKDLEEGRYIWTQLWGTESEVREWFSQVTNHTKAQLKEPQHILRVSPFDHVVSLRIKKNQLEQRLSAFNKRSARRVESRITQLQGLRVLKVEKDQADAQN